MTNSNAMCSKPTAPQRFWSFLGFGRPGRDYMDDLEGSPDFCESYLSQTIELVFDWKDRLRILFSGRVVVEVSTKTDKPIDKALTRARIGVDHPQWIKS